MKRYCPVPLCRDPLVAQLNSMGFNALRVPRSDYVPPALLVRRGGSPPVLWGPLTDGFEAPAPPTPFEAAAGQLSAATTAAYRKSTALRLAADWLGTEPARLSGAFDGVRRITFHIGDMRALSVPLSKLTDYLLAAEPTPALMTLSGSRLFAITEVLQAKGFTLVAENEAMHQAAVAGSIENLGGADFTVDSAKAASGVVVFRSTSHHTVGFKAYEIEIAGGLFGLIKSGGSTGLSHLADGEPAYHPVVFDDFAF